MRILIIEDNHALAALLAERLSARGVHNDVALCLQEADDLIAVGAYDALLLDLGLPDGDGLDWLRGLGRDRPPALVLTARGTLSERVLGLDRGADDYLVKPAEAEEIAARLRAIVRRPGARRETRLTFDTLEFDTVSRQAACEGKPVPLGVKEAEMLEVLMLNAGRVVPRERLEAAIYGLGDPVTPNALEALASRLRRRLSDAGLDNLLHAVRGVGYYLGKGATQFVL